MKLSEAVEAIRTHSHVLLVCDELIDYIDKLSSGGVDIPLPEGESISAEALDALRSVVEAKRKGSEKEVEKIRGFDVVQRRKRSSSPSKPKPKPKRSRKAAG